MDAPEATGGLTLLHPSRLVSSDGRCNNFSSVNKELLSGFAALEETFSGRGGGHRTQSRIDPRLVCIQEISFMLQI